MNIRYPIYEGVYRILTVQFHRVELPPSAPPPTICDFGANCSPPARASVFCCKTEWCCKKHSLLCSGEHKSFLFGEERALSGKAGISDRRKANCPFPVGWRKVRKWYNQLYITNISHIMPNGSHLCTRVEQEEKRVADDG